MPSWPQQYGCKDCDLVCDWPQMFKHIQKSKHGSIRCACRLFFPGPRKLKQHRKICDKQDDALLRRRPQCDRKSLFLPNAASELIIQWAEDWLRDYTQQTGHYAAGPKQLAAIPQLNWIQKAIPDWKRYGRRSIKGFFGLRFGELLLTSKRFKCVHPHHVCLRDAPAGITVDSIDPSVKGRQDISKPTGVSPSVVDTPPQTPSMAASGLSLHVTGMTDLQTAALESGLRLADGGGTATTDSDHALDNTDVPGLNARESRTGSLTRVALDRAERAVARKQAQAQAKQSKPAPQPKKQEPSTGKKSKSSRKIELAKKRSRGKITSRQDMQRRNLVRRDGGLSVRPLLPWEHPRTRNLIVPDKRSLHEQIQGLVDHVALTDVETRARRSFLQRLRTLFISEWGQSTISVFGSFACNVSIFSADLDLSLDTGLPTDFRKVLKIVRRAGKVLAKEEWIDRFEVRASAKVPIVCVVEKHTLLEADIGIEGQGAQTTGFLQQSIRLYPAFRPLVMVMKCFLSQTKLDKPFTGGLGSFKLYGFMARFFEAGPRTGDLGVLLVNLLDSIGRGRWTQNFHVGQPPHRVEIQISKMVQMPALQRACCVAVEALRSCKDLGVILHLPELWKVRSAPLDRLLATREHWELDGFDDDIAEQASVQSPDEDDGVSRAKRRRTVSNRGKSTAGKPALQMARRDHLPDTPEPRSSIHSWSYQQDMEARKHRFQHIDANEQRNREPGLSRRFEPVTDSSIFQSGRDVFQRRQTPSPFQRLSPRFSRTLPPAANLNPLFRRPPTPHAAFFRGVRPPFGYR